VGGVSFQAPLFLLALVLAPLGVIAYVRAQRRRHRFAVRYPALETLAAVLPRHGGARRHLPAVLYGLALCALVVALARPEATVAVDRERASVMLATDTSGSMQAKDVSPDRMTAVRRAGNDFLGRVPDDVRVGVVSFSSSAQTLQLPTVDRSAVRRALAGLRPKGGTATGDAIDAALRSLRPRRSDRTPAAIVLLSDGKETKGVNSLEAALRARDARVPVYTVALGTPTGSIEVRRGSGQGTRRQPVPPDAQTLREIARRSGGRFFSAPNARALTTVYERLGSSVARVRERQQVTAGFAGGALALVLVAGALSLLWSGRLP
jgi:Ca-activated chloride channel family protein